MLPETGHTLLGHDRRCETATDHDVATRKAVDETDRYETDHNLGARITAGLRAIRKLARDMFQGARHRIVTEKPPLE